jgi:hypothetical protein
MTLFLLVVVAFAVVPAAIFLFNVMATEPREGKAAIRAGLKHFGAVAALAATAGIVLLLFFQC